MADQLHELEVDDEAGEGDADDRHPEPQQVRHRLHELIRGDIAMLVLNDNRFYFIDAIFTFFSSFCIFMQSRRKRSEVPIRFSQESWIAMMMMGGMMTSLNTHL